MAADIGQELYEKVKKSFDEGYASHEHIQNLIKRIKSGKADMIDVSSYSRSLGYVLSNAIRENVNADVLPDGQMYYNIAQKILSPLLHDNHTMVNDIAAEVQQKLDERRNIRIRPQKAPFPEERLSSIVSAASEEGLDEATMKRRMSSPAETMTASFSDDYMKENAKFRTRAGFKEYIVRKDDGNCCEWCAKLAGKYLYPESTPHDVFRRHDNCGCSVTYEDGGMRQDVWSKRTWEASPEELAERRELEEKNKPVRFSPEEAARKEKEVRESINYAKAIEVFDFEERDTISFISPQAIANNLEHSVVGREALAYIKDSGIKPKLIYEPQNHRNRGQQQGNDIRIFMVNITNTRVAAQTVIHEITHHKYGISKCQWAEAVCMAKEKMHKENKTSLTIAEKRYIVKLAKDNYDDLNWKKGGLRYGKPLRQHRK